jgi:hypothetical protein
VSGDWRFVSMSDPVYWTCERRPKGCWKCRVRKVARWPRPYRHWNCGPVRDPFPGVPTITELDGGPQSYES